tara:strand:+ start:357 stop:860 length:504 start_codon:yes stop_codon:yes gene_type:complete
MYKAKVNGKVFEIELSKQTPLKGTINGSDFDFDYSEIGIQRHLLYNNKSYTIELVSVDRLEKTCVVKVNNNEIIVSVEDRFDLLLDKLGMDSGTTQKMNDLLAPMPGLVLEIYVEVGDPIKKGDNLIVLEAMKMENIIKSSTDGVVKAIEVSCSEAVEKNQVLIQFE